MKTIKILLGLILFLIYGLVSAQEYNYSGNISGNVTFTGGNVYYIDNISVNNGATLTIQPGSIIKIKNGKQFNVNGNLQAVGTSANPIIFTSYNDDSVGGIAPGSTGTPVKGAWEYIYFSGGGSNGSVLEYTQIKYGGGNGNYGAINMYSSNATIKNTTIIGSKYSGIYMYNSSPIIDGNAITNSGYEGIFLNASSPTINNNIISNNAQEGIDIASGNPTITNNTISGNIRSAIWDATTTTPTITGNTLTGNAWDVVYHRTYDCILTANSSRESNNGSNVYYS